MIEWTLKYSKSLKFQLSLKINQQILGFSNTLASYHVSVLVCSTTNESYSVKKSCKCAVTSESSNEISHFLCPCWKYRGYVVPILLEIIGSYEILSIQWPISLQWTILCLASLHFTLQHLTPFLNFCSCDVVNFESWSIQNVKFSRISKYLIPWAFRVIFKIFVLCLVCSTTNESYSL